MRLLRLTDVHFDCLSPRQRSLFLSTLKAQEPEAVLLGGDLSTARRLTEDLEAIRAALSVPVYFVLGNHDLLDLPKLQKLGVEVHLLDGNCLNLDHLTIGDVGGIIGDPKRTNRKRGPEFYDLLLDVLEKSRPGGSAPGASSARAGASRRCRAGCGP